MLPLQNHNSSATHNVTKAPLRLSHPGREPLPLESEPEVNEPAINLRLPHLGQPSGSGGGQVAGSSRFVFSL